MGFCKVQWYSGNQSNWKTVFLYTGKMHRLNQNEQSGSKSEAQDLPGPREWSLRSLGHGLVGYFTSKSVSEYPGPIGNKGQWCSGKYKVSSQVDLASTLSPASCRVSWASFLIYKRKWLWWANEPVCEEPCHTWHTLGLPWIPLLFLPSECTVSPTMNTESIL